MKILITNFFSGKNKGDAAILSVTIAELRRVFGDPEIAVMVTEPSPGQDARFGKDIRFVGSFFYHAIYACEKWQRPLMAIYVLLATTLYASVLRVFDVRLSFILTRSLREASRAYHDVDIVIPIGGGYLTGKDTLQGNITIILQLHAIAIALIYRKPVYMFPQSVGPFGNRFQKTISANILNRVHTIFTREAFTEKALLEIGVDKPEIIRSVDLAFLFSVSTKGEMRDYLKKSGVDLGKPLVGITVRRFLGKDAQDRYEMEMAAFIDGLVAKDTQVVVIPQVTSTLYNDDDRLVADRIEKMLTVRGPLFVLDELDHDLAKGIYENMDWFFGTRMHSCIFALSAGVPTVAIEYEYKTAGIMKNLGLDRWVIRMEDVTCGRLTEMYDAMKSGEAGYRETLSRNMSDHIALARRTTELLTEKLARDNP